MKERIKITAVLIGLMFVYVGGSLYNASCGKAASKAVAEYNGHTDSVLISSYRGTVYDRNMKSIIGKEYQNGVLVNPLLLDKEELDILYNNIPKEEIEAVKMGISYGAPFYVAVNKPINLKGFVNISSMSRYPKTPIAQNLLGYVNADGQGVGGIEECYNGYLSVNEEYKVGYEVNALGQMLDGLGLTFYGSPNGVDKGVVLTLDKDIQKVCEAAADIHIKNGAIIVQKVGSGEILACVSRPTYNPCNAEDSLNTEGAFLNKAFEEYCCGSAFKIVVSAAAIENSDEVNFSYNCKGYYNAGGVKIGCSDTDGHGSLNLKEAFAKSCNSYFCNLASQLGPEKVYDMAVRFGLGKEIDLGNGMVAKSGKLPSVSSLSSPAALANFSIGQGELLVTPLQISSITNTIASGGILSQPAILEGYSENGKDIIKALPLFQKRVISAQTAAEIQNLMEYAVKYGTGVHANPVAFGAGAKTSTAETGIYSNNNQVYHTWVTGFVPANTPKYTVTVLVEGGISGYSSAAPVMKTIADSLISLGLY